MRQLIQHYDVRIILRSLNQLSSHITREGKQGIAYFDAPNVIGPRQNGRLFATQHLVALVSKFVLDMGVILLNSPMVPQSAILELLGLCAQLVDPQDDMMRDSSDILPLLVRLGWQQFGYQDAHDHLIPRAILMYRDAEPKVQDARYNIASEFTKKTGISLLDFMRIGFMTFANLHGNDSVPLPFELVSELGHLQILFALENIKPFKSIMCISLDKARTEIRQQRQRQNDVDLYGWNPLLGKPIIQVERDRWTAPVLPLLLYKVADAPFWVLQEAAAGPGVRNAFRGHFGYVFEQYVGIHLKQRYGAESVYHESQIRDIPKRGKELGRPDWVVVDGDTALVIETKAASLAMSIKTTGSPQKLTEYLTKLIVDVACDMRPKIEWLSTGKAGVPWENINHVVPIVITYQSLYPEAVVKHHMLELMRSKGSRSMQFEWMDAQGFEEWIASNPSGSPTTTLIEKWSTSDNQAAALRDFLVTGGGKDYFSENKLLQGELEAFFHGFSPRISD